MNPEGKESRSLAVVALSWSLVRLTWSVDSAWVLAPDRFQGKISCIFAFHADTGERRRVTTPTVERNGDLSPAVSPDGRMLAFTRDVTRAWREIFIAPIDSELRAGAGERLTSEALNVDSLAWTANGQELVFGAALPSGGTTYLYRVSRKDKNVKNLAGVRIEGNAPAISRQGALAFSRLRLEPTTVQAIDLPKGKPAGILTPRLLLSSTSRDYSLDFSPSGTEIVMSSIRAGAIQLWVFPASGGAPKQLTFLAAGANIPRWSPDGRWIAFSSLSESVEDVFLISPQSGEIRQQTNNRRTEMRPTWSRDGKLIYFGRLMDDGYQVFRQPIVGGEARQVTRQGGSFALESIDGKWLYVTDHEPGAEIYRMPIEGGHAERVVDSSRGGSAMAMSPEGIYYLTAPSASGASQLRFQSNDSKISQLVAEIRQPVHNSIALSPDYRTLVFTRGERVQSDLLLIGKPFGGR
jgi:Tol biopolymer transport system component